MSLPTRVQRVLSHDPFDVFGRDFGALMDRFFSARESAGGTLAPYGVDVREDNDHLYVEAEVPGFKKDEIDITLENSTLTITAERNPNPTEEQKGEWLLRERRYSKFSRSFTLPPTVDEGTVDARLENGVLKITLNKREESKPRKIVVN